LLPPRSDRAPHSPRFPDEPDYLGLTREQAEQLAAERGLKIRFVAGRANIDPQRITAELQDGIVVAAQRV
jgi:hypothetical protein